MDWFVTAGHKQKSEEPVNDKDNSRKKKILKRLLNYDLYKT